MPLAAHHSRSHGNRSPFHAHVIRFIPSTYNLKRHTYIHECLRIPDSIESIDYVMYMVMGCVCVCVS